MIIKIILLASFILTATISSYGQQTQRRTVEERVKT